MRGILVISAAAVLAAAGCSSAPVPKPAADPRPKVVATSSVVGFFARTLGGNDINVTTLVGPDGDPHTYEPTPADMVAVREADLLIEVGVHFEPWLDKLYAASGSKAKRVVTSTGIAFIKLGAETDPHVWHAVPNARIMVEQIRDGLVAADPNHADTFKDNAKTYLAELDELDKWVRETVAKLPPADRKLVTSHDTFGYFAKAYGFTVSGSVLPLSTEAADPSAADFAALVEKVKREKVRAVFAEATHNANLIERLAKEAKVRVGGKLFTDGLGAPSGDAGTYEGMMRHNVTTICEALKP